MSLGPSDLYRNIEAVTPGVIYSYSIHERVAKEIYCCRKTFLRGELKHQFSLNILSRSLKGAISRNLVGDYPGCLLLSGGVDSSLLSLITARFLSQESVVETYSVSFTNDKNSEKNYRDEILKNCKNIKNTELIIDPKEFFINLIEYIKKSRRLPVIPNEIALYALFRIISKDGYRMALSGEGADEIFDGYHYIRDAAITNLLRSLLSLALIKKIVINIVSRFGSRFLRYLEDPDSLLRIISIGNHIYFDSQGYYDLKRIKELLIDYYLTGLLYRADNASMMNSVELRVPFLSNLITDRYLCLPNKFLSIIFPPKFLPKLLLSSLVNLKFAFSKKRGFAIPWGAWYLESKEFQSLWGATKCFIKKTNLYKIPDRIEGDEHFGDFFERIGFRLMSLYLYTEDYNVR
jgi:asparagine synthase (glutamine-hydrolysing)